MCEIPLIVEKMQPFLPLLVGLQAIAVAVMWRLRWRDYALPAKLLRRQAASVVSEDGQSGSGAEAERDLMLRTDGVQLHVLPVPRLSVVIPCYNQAGELRRLLPVVMQQQFAAFEVIVVDEASEDETRELLEYYETQYPNLRHTYVPLSSVHANRRKLAVTLGMRAARASWVLVTSADCCPESSAWLSGIYRYLSEDYDFALGYANYGDDGTVLCRRAVYERLRRYLRTVRAACGSGEGAGGVLEMNGKAIGGDASNLVVRKDWFLENSGYAGSLMVACDEGELLVDGLSRSGRTVVVLDTDTAVRQSLPQAVFLQSERAVRSGTTKFLSRQGRGFLWREGMASVAAYVYLAVFLVLIFLRVADGVLHQAYRLEDLITDVPAVLLLGIVVFLPAHLLRKTTDMLGERSYSPLLVMHYALAQPWRNVMARIRFWRWRHGGQQH